MVPTRRRASLPPLLRHHRRSWLAVAALATSVTIGLLTPATTSGAWFTATQSRTGNSISAATLQPVSGLTATQYNDRNTVRWLSANQQSWATANNVTTHPTYTVTRTIDGKNPTTVYTGGQTTTTDSYSSTVTGSIPSSFSAGADSAGNIQSDGSVWTWGTGQSGSLGVATDYAPNPVKVTIPGGRSAVELTYSFDAATVLAADGTVWFWGGMRQNSDCSGTMSNVNTPTQVQTPAGKTIVSVSPSDRCAILQLASDGTLWTTPFRGSPTQVVLPGNRRVTQLTKGAMVLASDGTVWAWDSNSTGQTGNGSTSGYYSSNSPVQAILPAGTYATRVASYGANAAFLLNNNTIWTVGTNNVGQLGAGLSNTGSYGYSQQFKVPSDKTWVDVRVGSANIAALASDGSIYIAGQGNTGVLGNGSQSSTNVPVAAKNPGSVQFKSFDLGDSSVYAADQNSNYFGWGINVNSNSQALFGNNNNPSGAIYYYPYLAATNQQYTKGKAPQFCFNGGAANSAGYCLPPGNVSYQVSYTYGPWSAASQSVSSLASVTQTGSAVIGGPGGSNLCLTIQGNGAAQGTAVVLAACDSSSVGQKWTTWSDGSFRANGKCLDMKGDTPGTVVQRWDCNGLSYQWWVPRDDGSMYNPSSGLCLADPSGTAATGVQQQIAKCDGSASQKWKIS